MDNIITITCLVYCKDQKEMWVTLPVNWYVNHIKAHSRVVMGNGFYHKKKTIHIMDLKEENKK